MLLMIRDYLQERGVCSLAEISAHCKTSPDAMRGMLSHWQRKGLISTVPTRCQKGCVSCSPEQLQWYRWVGADPACIPLCQLPVDGC